MVSLNFQITTSSKPSQTPKPPPPTWHSKKLSTSHFVAPTDHRPITTNQGKGLAQTSSHQLGGPGEAQIVGGKCEKRLLELSSETLWPQFSDTYIIHIQYISYLHILFFFSELDFFKKEKTKFKSERKKNMQATFQLSNQTPPRLFPRQKSVIHIAPHSGTNGLTIS